VENKGQAKHDKGYYSLRYSRYFIYGNYIFYYLCSSPSDRTSFTGLKLTMLLKGGVMTMKDIINARIEWVRSHKDRLSEIEYSKLMDCLQGEQGNSEG